MKRPLGITLVAGYLIVSGMLSLLLLANMLSPNAAITAKSPLQLVLGLIGSGLFLYAGFELLKMRRLGMILFFPAMISRLILMSLYSNGPADVIVVGLFALCTATLGWHRKRFV
jgi:hypothetical protein